MGKILLSFKNVSIRYDAFYAIKHCSFEVNEGEIFGLLGPNGAGKSTLIRAISREIGYEGKIFFMGKELREISRGSLNRIIGIVPQDPYFFKDFTVYENLKLAAKLYSLPKIEEVVENYLSKFLLSHYKNKPARLLSGGCKRLVSIAMSTIHDPLLVIMDEPTVGLDPEIRGKIWDIIKKLRAEGKTIILTTHYLDEASMLCDRVAIINNGILLSCGTPQELIAQYGGNTKITVFVDKDPSPLLNALKKIPNVISVKISDKQIEVECKNRYAVRVIRDLVLIIGAPPYWIKPLSSSIKEPTLADAFLAIVGLEIGL